MYDLYLYVFNILKVATLIDNVSFHGYRDSITAITKINTM